MDISIIRNEEDHSMALERLSKLIAASPPLGSKEREQLELLALVIEDFEKRRVPPVRPDPIEAIKFRMEQQGLRRADLVPYIGSPSKVSEVLRRKRPLSLSMIRKLHAGLGIPAEVLLGDARPIADQGACRTASHTGS